MQANSCKMVALLRATVGHKMPPLRGMS